MAIKLTSLRVDIRRENDGDWIDIPDLAGVALKVRGANYGPFVAAKGIVDNRFARKWLSRGQNVPAETAYTENAKLYADHILLDWRGFDEPYSEERAAEILGDPAFRPLHDHIRYAMQMVAETEAEFVTDAAKNSDRSSGGNLTAAATPPTGSPI